MEGGSQYGFYFDSTRCTGCKTCVLACKDYKGIDADEAFRRVLDYEGGEWSAGPNGTWEQTAFVYHLSLSCNHCGNPVCTMVCPTGAMHKDAETGLVLVDGLVCVGCGYCELSCPYHAPKVSSMLHRSTKCDGCRDRLREGKAPICVEACPLRALEFGEYAKLRRRPGTVSAVAPMPDSAATAPHIAIRPCGCACPPGDFTTGHIANELEL
uniref:Dimethylsulfoxide reductase subunit B n=1 Tax=Muribaculaceae bacterium Z82 TaxID=2304548 RepID=A0A7C9NBL5_9BACT